MASVQEAFHLLTNVEFRSRVCNLLLYIFFDWSCQVPLRDAECTYSIVRYFINKYEAHGLVAFSPEDEGYLANWGLNPGTWNIWYFYIKTDFTDDAGKLSALWGLQAFRKHFFRCLGLCWLHLFLQGNLKHLLTIILLHLNKGTLSGILISRLLY